MLARFFDRLFTLHARATPELSRALRAAALVADTPEARDEYTAAADALDRVMTLAQQHSDAPTRDAFSYALGRAELDLDDKLSELIEVSKEDHLLIQDMHATQAEQGAAAGTQRDEFQAFVANLTAWRSELETWRPQVDAALATLLADARANQAMCDQVAALNDQVAAMAQHIREIEDQLIAEGPRERLS